MRTDFRALTDTKLNALFAQLRGSLCWKVVRLLFSGLALTETLRLRVRDLDMDSGVLRVRSRRTGRPRSARIPGQLRYDLYHETVDKLPTDPLFALRGDGPGTYSPLSTRSVQLALQTASAKLGLSVTVHTLHRNLEYRLVRWGFAPAWIASELALTSRSRIERIHRAWLRELRENVS